MLIEGLALREPLPFPAPRFRPAPPVPTLGGLFAGQPREAVAPGLPLFWQGDKAMEVVLVLKGAFRTVRILGDGRRVITGFAFAGDLIGVGQHGRYRYTAEAIEGAEVRRLGRARFETEIDDDAELRPLLLTQLRAEMAATQEHMVLLARKTAEERVCSFLLHLARRRPSRGNAVDLPMTRLDMADYLGLTIETVSRAMTRLQATGIIAQQGRHVVVLRQPEKLAALAAEENDDGEDGASPRRH